MHALRLEMQNKCHGSIFLRYYRVEQMIILSKEFTQTGSEQTEWFELNLLMDWWVGVNDIYRERKCIDS